MAHSDHFHLADDLIAHLDPVLACLHDPFIEARYTGFLAVSAVTVLELSMKTIFLDFAVAKHNVLACFCGRHFERINGRIGLDMIRDDYLVRFGNEYKNRFIWAVKRQETRGLKVEGTSYTTSYRNLLTWRHGFAHQGIIPPNATYDEVKRAYHCGKVIMACLAWSLRR